MFDIVHSYKSEYMFFATVNPNKGHHVFLSSYGSEASTLLEKFVEDQKADNEELFAEWDKLLQEAALEVGFAATHPIEDGHIYITSFQNGIGVSEEEDAAR